MKTFVVNEALCSRCGRPGGECRCAGRRATHNADAAVDLWSMELMAAPPLFPDADHESEPVRGGIVLNAEPGDGSELMGTEIDWQAWAGRATKRPDRRAEPERVTVNRHDGLTDAERLMIPPAF